MSEKVLTIAIPVFNTKLEYLERCLLSLPNDPRVCVYIYDDFSTDYCVELEIKKIIDKHPEQLNHLYKDGNKFVQNEENMGLGFVRNRAIRDAKEVKSKYILFLDSDDEIRLNNKFIDLDYLGSESTKTLVYACGIDLINEDNDVHTETSDKYLNQCMIPYLITPNIYNVEYLFSSNLYFDESRRVFEDIPFSVKLWTDLITGDLMDLVEFNDFPIYKYHLYGQSLTRNDRQSKLIEDLMYWVDWMRKFYSNLTLNKERIKPFIFNRIRYEAVKALSMRVEIDGNLPAYKRFLDLMKPYKIDDILN